jgi:hypothetical protein
MNKNLQYLMLLIIALTFGGSGYYFYTQGPQPAQVLGQIFREHNKVLFDQLSVKYLKNIEVITPIVRKIDVRHTERYLSDPEHYDALERKYGSLIAKGHLPPMSVKFINDTIGYGVFAEDDIEVDELVGEYTGYVINTNDLKDSKYSWSYPVKHDERGNKVATSLDAFDAGNEMRFVNHDYQPNAVIQMVPQGGLWHAVYIANRTIKKSEQILTSYGSKYWSGKRKDHLHTFVNEAGVQEDVLSDK